MFTSKLFFAVMVAHIELQTMLSDFDLFSHGFASGEYVGLVWLLFTFGVAFFIRASPPFNTQP